MVPGLAPRPEAAREQDELTGEAASEGGRRATRSRPGASHEAREDKAQIHAIAGACRSPAGSRRDGADSARAPSRPPLTRLTRLAHAPQDVYAELHAPQVVDGAHDVVRLHGWSTLARVAVRRSATSRATRRAPPGPRGPRHRRARRALAADARTQHAHARATRVGWRILTPARRREGALAALAAPAALARHVVGPTRRRKPRGVGGRAGSTRRYGACRRPRA